LFFFHYRDGRGLVPDLEGEEFTDRAAAHGEAVLAAREIVGEALLAGRKVHEDACFEVVDEANQLVARVMLISTAMG
jgi:hypothetical protein